MESLLRRRDPRVKMAMVIALSGCAMIKGDIESLLLINAITLLTLVLGRVAIGKIIKSIKGFLVLIGSVFILQCFFVRSGEPLLLIGRFTLITTGGFNMAALIFLRFLCIVLSALILLESRPKEYTLALFQMKMPYDIAFSLMLGLNFLPLLREEAINVFYATQLRGAEFKSGSLKKRIALYTKICLPILVNTLLRAKEMAIAMETRGVRAFALRTYLEKLSLKRVDIILIVLYLSGAVVFMGFA